MQSDRKKKRVVSVTTVFSMVVSLFTGIGAVDTMAAQVSTYEAEAAIGKGTNNVGSDQCSGGAKTGDIGTIDGKAGTVTFSVFAEKDGEYDATVYACTQGERYFNVSVNSGLAQKLVCNGNSFEEPVAYRMKLNLQKGENRVTFANPNEAAPDLDKLEVEGNLTEGVLSVEAESFELGGAQVSEGVDLSNGHYVGYIGGLKNGVATYKVNAAEAGKRKLYIHYAAAEARKVDIKVNGTSHALACWDTGSWTSPCIAPGVVEVDFVQGENIIQLTGIDGGDAPNIDRIQIEMTDEEAQEAVKKMIAQLPANAAAIPEDDVTANAVWVSYQTLANKGKIDSSKLNNWKSRFANTVTFNYEAEAAAIETKDALEVVYTDACSNNYYVGGMGIVNDGRLVFKVNAEEAASRNLKIYYITEQERKINVSVNNGTAQTLDCTNLEQTDWSTPESRPVSAKINLKKGENTILLSAAEEYTPNIDRIEIELTNEEAAETVETMISNLPVFLTDDNQMIFTAVKMAYDGLSNKDAVTNYSKLQDAFENAPPTNGNGNQSNGNQSNGNQNNGNQNNGNQSNGNQNNGNQNNGNQENNNGNSGNQKPGDGEEDLPENFAVIFDSAGGSTVFEQTVVEGELVKEPAAPTKDGYVFAGWYVGDKKYDFSVPIGKDLRLTAKWETSELKAAQDAYLALQGKIRSMNSDLYTVLTWSRLEQAYAEAREEYDRGVAADGGRLQTLVDELQLAVDELIRIVEESYIVTFDSAGGTEVAAREVVGGKSVTRPDDPKKAGYTFMGWFLNDVEYDFTSRVEQNILLKAKWEITNLKIVQEQYVALKDKKNALNKVFYTQESWDAMEAAFQAAKAEYDHGEAANAAELQALVSALDKAIEALEIRVIEETYVVTFTSTEGAEPFEQVVKKGKSATEPKDPSKEGYVFVGWYLDGKPYDFSVPVEGDLKLTARWEPAQTQKPDSNQGSDNKTPPDGTVNDNSANQPAKPDIGNTQLPGGTVTDPNLLTNQEQVEQVPKVLEITISGSSHEIAAGQDVDLTADIWPIIAEQTPIVWSSSHPEYATVDELGRVTTKAAGKNRTVTITATATDGSGTRAEYEIQLKAKAVKKIKISAATKEVKAGKKVKLKTQITPKASRKMMNSKLEWISSNPDYATVNAKGVVKTRKAGKGKKVKITAIATDGSNKKASIKLKLK